MLTFQKIVKKSKKLAWRISQPVSMRCQWIRNPQFRAVSQCETGNANQRGAPGVSANVRHFYSSFFKASLFCLCKNQRYNEIFLRNQITIPLSLQPTKVSLKIHFFKNIKRLSGPGNFISKQFLFLINSSQKIL